MPEGILHNHEKRISQRSSDGEHVSILRLASVEVIKLANASTKTFEVGPAADVAHAAGSPDRSATIFGCIKAVFCYLRTITPRVSLSVLVSSHQSRFSSFPTVCAISELKFVFFPKRYQSGLIKSIVYPWVCEDVPYENFSAMAYARTSAGPAGRPGACKSQILDTFFK